MSPSCAARINPSQVCHKTVTSSGKKKNRQSDGDGWGDGGDYERYLISESISSDRPSPLFSSRPVLNSHATPLKKTFQVVALCCKTLSQGLGAVEPSDRGPAVPFLDERTGREENCWEAFKCFHK